MMKEAEKAMQEISPEDKKMMEEMGVKIPDMQKMQKTVSGMSDAQISKAYEDANRLVPEKDLARIASISKTPLTNSSLPAFLAAANAKVILQLKSESKTQGEEIYKLIKAENNSAAQTGNAAAGLWMMGKVELAVYIMGKACLDDPANANNLDNYAAMLSMAGAEQLSIPMLYDLNRRYPRNSTILNNIGQAWFGLGDVARAEIYLDSTISIYAYHPQANFTKSFIEENKGNKQGAIDAAKRSIKGGYSGEKETRLHKLGYDLESKDIYWDRRMPQDPLGLERFKWPDFPMNVDQSKIMEKEWDIFKESCKNEIEKLNGQLKKAEETFIAVSQVRTQQLLKAGSNGQNVSLYPPLANKAIKKLNYLVDDKDGHLSHGLKQRTEAIGNALIEIGNNDQKLSAKIEQLDKKYEDLFGEGKPNPFSAACRDYNDANNNFLVSVNPRLQQTQTDYLNFMRRYLNDQIYYDQYTMWPEEFEMAKTIAKIQWLGAISDQRIMFKDKNSNCLYPDNTKTGNTKLVDFDDVHCEYHSELKLPVGKINVDCSRVTSELDLKIIKLGLKQNMDKGTNDGSVMQNFADQFMSCSVEIGVSESAGFNSGVLKAEASAGVAIRAELDRTGLTDVILKSDAGVSMGTNIIDGGSMMGVGVSDLSVEAGVKGQISLISGKSSVESTGLLDGVFKK